MKLVISAELIITERVFEQNCKNIKKAQYNYNCSDISSKYNDVKSFIVNISKLSNTKNNESIEEIADEILSALLTTNAGITMPFILGLFNFLQRESSKLLRNNVSSCHIIWPSAFSKSVKKHLKVNPHEIINELKELLRSISETSELDYFDLSNQIGTNTHITSLFLTNLANQDIQSNNSKAVNNLFSQKKLDLDVKNKLLQIIFHLELPNDKYFIKSCETEQVYYFVEDLDSDINNILQKNDKVLGLSFYTDDIYDYRILNLFKILTSTIDYDIVDSHGNEIYELNFIEALDTKLYLLLNSFVNDPEMKSIYIACDNDFILSNINNYVNYHFRTDFTKIKPSQYKESIKRHDKYIIVNDLDNITEYIKQREIHNSLKSNNSGAAKVVFCGKQLPKVAHGVNNAWSFDPMLIENNISKIFHSLYSKDISQTIPKSIISLINTNEFNPLLKKGLGNIDLNLLLETLDKINNLGGFNYKYLLDWYQLFNIYTEKFNNLVTEHTNNADTKEKTTVRIRTKDQNKRIVFEFPDGEAELDYDQGMTYLLLILWNYKYSVEKRINVSQLVTIGNSHIGVESLKILKRRLVDKDYTAHSDKTNVSGQLFDSNKANKYPPLLRNFIDAHIEYKLESAKSKRNKGNEYFYYFSEIDTATSKPYTVEFDKSISFDIALFESNYEEILLEKYKQQLPHLKKSVK